MGGKLFTIFYAIISIPIFMWYIYRLGGAFRLVFMKAICILLLCVWYIKQNISLVAAIEILRLHLFPPSPYPNPTTEVGDHRNHRPNVEDPSFSQQVILMDF